LRRRFSFDSLALRFRSAYTHAAFARTRRKPRRCASQRHAPLNRAALHPPAQGMQRCARACLRFRPAAQDHRSRPQRTPGRTKKQCLHPACLPRARETRCGWMTATGRPLTSAHSPRAVVCFAVTQQGATVCASVLACLRAGVLACVRLHACLLACVRLRACVRACVRLRACVLACVRLRAGEAGREYRREATAADRRAPRASCGRRRQRQPSATSAIGNVSVRPEAGNPSRSRSPSLPPNTHTRTHTYAHALHTHRRTDA
jgi:hypothetical protein